MKIYITLMGALREYTPEDNTLEFMQTTTVGDVLEQLGIDERRVQVVSVNNRFEHARDRVLQDGDRLVVMPAVVGG